MYTSALEEPTIIKTELKYAVRTHKVYFYKQKFETEKNSNNFIQKIFNLEIILNEEIRNKTRNVLYDMHLSGVLNKKEKLLFALLVMGPSKLNRINHFFLLNYETDCKEASWQNRIRYILTNNSIFEKQKKTTLSYWCVKNLAYEWTSDV
ncbi:hypothetical protein CDIK_0440 [Cucumispora dikerogammari]|nr:hypothetical protein CDIK_0440 [Cucumispora dikerogammari]